MKQQLLLILDAGHGGMINGEYTTAPAKMYKHSEDDIAYEGLINRGLKKHIIKYWSMDERPYYDVTSGSLDIDLINRALFANTIARQYQDKYISYYLALHSNAGKGTGIEGFTTKGKTKSDVIMNDYILEELKMEFSDIKFRFDLSDGDLDKETDFYVLRKTICMAGLLEIMFFDNYNDWKWLQNDRNIDRCAYAIYKALCNYEKTNYEKSLEMARR